MDSSMLFDTGFIEILKSLNLDSSLERNSLKLLNQEATGICEMNIPGNFIQLPEGDDASAFLLAWVISRKTRETRTLFLPNSLLSRFSVQFAAFGEKLCILSVDGLLQEKGDARNWLGMVALIHLGGISTKSLITETCELLAGQLVENARIVIDGGYPLNNGLLHSQNAILASLSPRIYGNDLVLNWQKGFEPDENIPSSLVADFFQDDPLKRGIPTLMSANERFQLYYTVRELLPPGNSLVRFVEVGSFEGGTFYEVCKAFQRQQSVFQGVSIEPFSSSEFKEVLKNFGSNAVHLEMKSSEAAPILAGLFEFSSLPTFILIDGDHRYDAVCRDIRDYFPLLAPGGIIMFHDYLPPCNEQNREFIVSRKGGDVPSIGEACRELLDEQLGLHPIDLPRLYPTNLGQTMASQPIIPGVYSTIRAYRKPGSGKGA